MKHVNQVSIHVLEQLANVAQKQQESLEALVTHYAHERLLARLAVSSYEDQYWLYGDLLLSSLAEGSVKCSSGITLCTKKMANKVNIIKHAFEEICSMTVREDGISFICNKLEISSNGEDEVLIRLPAQLAQRTIYIEITITVLNSIPMAPKKIAVPTLLDNTVTELLAYPTELIIAYKFNKLYQFPALEQTMKDYYDVYVLASTQNFEGRVLQEAIMDTFDRHKTTLEKYPPMFATQCCLMEMKDNVWQQVIDPQMLTFDKVQKLVHQLLRPIYEDVIVEGEFFKNWDYQLCDWR